MKCLIYCSQEQTQWLKNYFPDLHPYSLRILNKPLLEYYIDFCAMHKIQEIRIIINESGSDIEKYFETGTKWGVNISYSLAKPDDSLKKVYLKNSNFCKGSDLLIINGFTFINYQKDKNNGVKLESASQHMKISSDQSAIYFLKHTHHADTLNFDNISSHKECTLSLTDLNDISTYYNLNMDILQNRQNHFVLPGYNNEENVYIGMNVVYNSNSVKLHKPIMIGDNIQIKDKAEIGPMTILGNNVIIDSASIIKNSIIYDASYIGSDLELDKKIVYKNHLINPETGDSIQIVDHFFVSEIEQKILQNSLYRASHRIIASFMILIYTLPYLLFLLLHKLCYIRVKRKNFYISSNKATMELPFWKIHKPNLLNSFFVALCLDKYPLYWKVLFNKLSLVGNRLLPQSPKNQSKINNFKFYSPGVFNYPGIFANKLTEIEYEMHESYYCHNSSMYFDLRIIFRTLFSRALSARERIKNEF